MKNKKYKIWIDSDGVLANFDSKVESFTGYKQSDWGKFKSKIWAAIQRYNDNVEPFFESLDKHDDADELVEFITNNFETVCVLTAKGSTPPSAGEQKIKWYEKHYPHLKVICVLKSPNKAEYACPDSILIDDREKSTDPFIKAGGRAILHKNAKDTIKQLQEYLQKSPE